MYWRTHFLIFAIALLFAAQWLASVRAELRQYVVKTASVSSEAGSASSR